jgi:hypothetical protein
MVPAGNALVVLSEKAHIPPLKISGIKRRSGFSGTRLYDIVCRVPEKPLRLAPQGHFLRGVYETFYDAITS